MATERPLVVIATDSSVPSGMGEHMLTLARAMHGDFQIVIAFSPVDDGAVFLKKAHVAGLSVRPIGAELCFSRWLRDIGADLLHVHAGIGWEGHALARAGRSAGMTVLRTEHLPYLLTDEAQRAEHRLGVGLVDRVILVSHAAAASYRDAGFTDAKCVTVQNGIELPRGSYPRDAIRRALGIEPDHLMVLTIARFTPQKNYRALIDAAQLVVRRLPGVRFVWVGDGPERGRMEDLALEAGLGRSANFVGVRNDAADLLSAADLFVLPSLFEGLPLSLLEAMALGLGIVATRIGGTCEALGDDYEWLVPPHDTKALAGAIVEAFADRDKLFHLGQRNQCRFNEYFRADRMGSETAALYWSLIAKSERAA
jgi:glycosyltransferase involved in cell wall biosynthesis